LEQWSVPVAVALAGGILLSDLLLPLGVAGGVPYVLLVFLGWVFPDRGAIFVLAAVATILTAVGYLYSPQGGVPWMVLANRGLALLAIWGTAIPLALVKKMQEALRESGERYRKYYHDTPAMLHSIDGEGRLVSVSDHWLAVMGYERGEVIGRKTAEFLSEESGRRARESVLPALLEMGRVTDIPYQFVKKNGEVIDTLISAVMEMDEAGKPFRSLSVVTDVTERKRAEEAVSESENRLRAVLDNVVVGIITIDQRGTVESFNPVAERMFGYRASDVIGRNVSMLMPEPHRSEHDGYLARYMSTGEARIISHGREVEGRRQDGSTFPLELGVSEVNLKGRLIFTGIATDVTERKRAEAELRQAQRLEGLANMSGGIAHNINNLLLPIIALSGMTARELAEGSAARERIEMVVKAGENAKDLVGRIMAFARQEKPGRATVDIYEVVHGVLELLPTMVPPTINTKTHLDEVAGSIRADAAEIQTVLMNLVFNAVDAMNGQAGDLDVSLSRVYLGEEEEAPIPGLGTGAYALITVVDTGEGMNETTLDHIFEPFYTTKEVGKGTGLGLSSAYGIVSAHGGTIRVISTPGEGSRFYVYLPLDDVSLRHRSRGAPPRQAATTTTHL
jgi:PAS domain S-box-containing protein